MTINGLFLRMDPRVLHARPNLDQMIRISCNQDRASFSVRRFQCQIPVFPLATPLQAWSPRPCLVAVLVRELSAVNDKGLLPGDAAVGLAPNSQYDLAISRGGDQFLVAWSDGRGEILVVRPFSLMPTFGIRL